MKKSLLFALAIGMMASCNNDPVPTPGGEEGDAVIRLSANSLNLSIEQSSRALGSLDSWKNSSVYIYSFKKNTPNFSIPKDEIECIIQNEEAIAQAGDTINLAWKDTKDRKYPETGSYDFFGYYIDDAAEGSIIEGEDSIYFKVKIDGTQDLMIAKAELTADDKATLGATTEHAKAYSAYTARRGVHPFMKFNHVLTRLKFQIEPGSAGADDVYIESIAVESVVDGKLVVVAKEGGFRGLRVEDDPSKVFLELKEERIGNDTLQALSKEKYYPKAFKPASGAIQDKTPVGESLLVVPAEDYKIKINMVQQFNDADESAPYNTTLSLSSGEFEAGHSYLVTLKVYGLEKVEVIAELIGWIDGEEIELDPEDDF